MKILHCINSLDIGGAEKTLVRLINSSNHKHRIITILDSQLLKSFLKKDVQLISIFPLNLKSSTIKSKRMIPKELENEITEAVL